LSFKNLPNFYIAVGTASTNIGLAIKQKQEPNIIEEDKKPNKQQSTLVNKQQQSTSSSLDKQQSTSNSLSAKLAKILSTWPFAQLQEVAKHNTNISAGHPSFCEGIWRNTCCFPDGEFVEACKKEIERRQKNYQEWRKQSEADYLC
jgi:hypothetical protein